MLQAPRSGPAERWPGRYAAICPAELVELACPTVYAEIGATLAVAKYTISKIQSRIQPWRRLSACRVDTRVDACSPPEEYVSELLKRCTKLAGQGSPRTAAFAQRPKTEISTRKTGIQSTPGWPRTPASSCATPLKSSANALKQGGKSRACVTITPLGLGDAGPPLFRATDS